VAVVVLAPLVGVVVLPPVLVVLVPILQFQVQTQHMLVVVLVMV